LKHKKEITELQDLSIRIIIKTIETMETIKKDGNKITERTHVAYLQLQRYHRRQELMRSKRRQAQLRKPFFMFNFCY